MINLSGNTWNNFFQGKDHYIAYCQKWVELTKKAQKGKIKLTAADYLRNAILRGRDWKKGFTMPKAEKRQGYNPFLCGSVWRAFYGMKEGLDKFDGLVTPEMLKKASSYINTPNNAIEFKTQESYKGGTNDLE